MGEMVERTVLLGVPLPESAGARCDECWWGAAGPWSHAAASTHASETGHRKFEFRHIDVALVD